MDKLEKYRNIIEVVVKKHAQYKPSHGQIESLSICDREADNYLLMDIGWDKTGRVSNCYLISTHKLTNLPILSRYSGKI